MLIFVNDCMLFLFVIFFKNFLYFLFMEVLFEGFLVVGINFFSVLLLVFLWIVMLIVFFNREKYKVF